MESFKKKKAPGKWIGWTLAVLWGIAFLLFAPLDSGIIGIIGIQLVLTAALTGVNIYFRKEKNILLWIVNGLEFLPVVFYLILMMSLWQLENGTRQDRRDAARVNLSGVPINRISEYDDHDNFLGDGISMRVYGVSKEESAERIKNAEGWRPFPLDRNAKKLLYGDPESLAYLHDSEQRTLAPYLENGYWFFEDRQAQDDEEKYSTDVLKRYSLNFTMALYDPVMERLYILDMDT